MPAPRLNSTVANTMSTHSTSSPVLVPPGTSARHQVELYAHALKARLQLASFKALHGVGSSSFTQLDGLTTTAASAKATDLQPLTVVPIQTSSTASTPALSQTESMPSSSQSSTSSAKNSRSLYVDIFGTDFKKSSPTSAAPKRTQSRASPSPSKRPRPSMQASSAPSLLDRAAAAPQLGSPQRRNGRFDWHNNPTPAMVAREDKLATAASFALPTGSPSKRRREVSFNAPGPSALSTAAVVSPPRRSRVQSNGTGFLPNGHPASSLAQDLGLTTPRTPRSRQTSARQGFAPVSETHTADEMGQDQEERDRVANTLAVMAESRYDSAHTPSVSNDALAARRHYRKVSWTVADKPQPAAPIPSLGQGQDDRAAAADYLLYLAASPSPSPTLSSTKRLRSIRSDRDGHHSDLAGGSAVLATPAHTSLWDPFKEEPTSSNVRHVSSTGNPLTPPPSSQRKLISHAALNGASNKARSATSPQRQLVVGLGLDADTMSASSTSSPSPELSSSTPSPMLSSAVAGSDGIRPSTPESHRPSNAEEYMLLREHRSPRTPPPTHSRTPSANGISSAAFRNHSGQFICTPPGAPGAPGMDTNFHYADFLNVSPSPQPPTSASFLGPSSTLSHSYLAQRTPTKSNRYRFGA